MSDTSDPQPAAGRRRWLLLPPLTLGLVVLIFVIRTRPGLQQQPIAEATRALRVIEVPSLSLVPRVVGYGTARPRDVWTAVAEVKGRVIDVHPDLIAGAILSAGDTVLRIDPTDYELQLAQLQAEIAQIESQQAELRAQEQNYQESLKIETASLALAERELARQRGLTQDSTVTQSEFEAQKREVFKQRQNVQSLRNSLNVLPAQQQALAATRQAKEASFQRAQRDLERTVIQAPFDCRLKDLGIEIGQFLSTGQTLFEAYSLDVMEVEAQFSIDQLGSVLVSDGQSIDLSADPMATMRHIFDVDATIRMRSGDFEATWEGEFDRVREALDLQTRTARVVIAVEKPFERVVPGKQPPLAPGMFCEVVLRGQPRADQIVVPRTAIRDHHVYVVDDAQRLARRGVEVGFTQGEIASISAGLTPGERLVVSDPTPAIEGMLVEPVLDDEARQSIVAEAMGEPIEP